MAIKIHTRDEKREAFRAMNDPARVIYQIAHARKENSAEPYEDTDVVADYEQVVDAHIEAADEVFGIFDKRGLKRTS